jgi:hypothetical protein
MEPNEVAAQIVDAAYQIHVELGPGWVERKPNEDSSRRGSARQAATKAIVDHGKAGTVRGEGRRRNWQRNDGQGNNPQMSSSYSSAKHSSARFLFLVRRCENVV